MGCRTMAYRSKVKSQNCSSKRRLAANAVNAACVRKAVHLEMREAVAAWRKGPECHVFWLGRSWWWKRRFPHSNRLPLRFLRPGATWNCEGVPGKPVLSLCGHQGVLRRQSALPDGGVHRRGWEVSEGGVDRHLGPQRAKPFQWLQCADHRCVGHVGRWGLPVGCGWWPVRRLRGTLWLLHVQWASTATKYSWLGTGCAVVA